jgi:hypothetical protein
MQPGTKFKFMLDSKLPELATAGWHAQRKKKTPKISALAKSNLKQKLAQFHHHALRLHQ